MEQSAAAPPGPDSMMAHAQHDEATFTEAPADGDAGPSSPQLRSRLAKAVHERQNSSVGGGGGEGKGGDDGDNDDGSTNEDGLFDELERELDEGGAREVMGRLREERMAELRRQIREEEAVRNAPQGSGKLTEPSSEKELIQILADRGGELGGASGGMPIVVHFYHKEFRRCDIMDKHLETLAAQHTEALFVKISVLSSPFLVEKLGVKVLPCLVVFGPRAQVKDRIVGFEDLGNSDGFTTQTLQWRLAQGGALFSRTSERGSTKLVMGYPSQQQSAQNGADDDDDLDWD